jgi:hypothetical protein
MISFGILDGSDFRYGPIHAEIHHLDDFYELHNVVGALVEVFKWKSIEDCVPVDELIYYGQCNNRNHKPGVHYTAGECDPSDFFGEEFWENEEQCINSIVQSLIKKSFFVTNRYNKYYSIAFAINYTRFEIYSFGCDKELIDWKDGKGIVSQFGIIHDPNYNESPVLKILRSLR